MSDSQFSVEKIALKKSVFQKIRNLCKIFLRWMSRPGNLIWRSDLRGLPPKLLELTSEAFMIVLRLLCDGILKGWNQDPAGKSKNKRMKSEKRT